MNGKLHKCTICGTAGNWSESWFRYGSIMHEEVAPDDIILLCSDKCKDELDLKLKTGEIKMTFVSPRGPYDYRIVGQRKGY